jgi:hypothetical protein
MSAAEVVPTNPSQVARHPDFPSDDLYRRIWDRVGKLEAERIWAGALVVSGRAHPSTVSS